MQADLDLALPLAFSTLGLVVLVAFLGPRHSAPERTALVLVAKWPGNGRAKTRLTTQMADAIAATCAEGPGEDHRRQMGQWTASFVRSCVSDLAVRFAVASESLMCDCVLLYSPPTEAARAWFAELLEELQVASSWNLLPVFEGSDGRSSNLSTILTDATRRARALCGCRRVAFLGSDCPELPLTSVGAVIRAAAEPKCAAICPAVDGGYTLLALPAEADAASAFAGVHWSAEDTCISQLTALTRAGMRCAVFDTHSDVDELHDVRGLALRLMSNDSPGHCPHTRRCMAALTWDAEGTLSGCDVAGRE